MEKPSARLPAGRRRRNWFVLTAAVALAAAAVFDWTRPPQRQLSVHLFDRVVIGGYRKVVRPVTSRFVGCRYYPTCSTYGEQAVHTHGFPRGAWLTTKRILRCGPWVPYRKWDPVPPSARRD